MNDIAKLEDELAEVERSKEEYEATIAGESQSQGRDVHLEDEQVILFVWLKHWFINRKDREARLVMFILYDRQKLAI